MRNAYEIRGEDAVIYVRRRELDDVEVFIDRTDLGIAMQFSGSWCLNRSYVYGTVRRSPRGRSVYLHRILLNAPVGLEVDHIDGNPLNNRRSNLRLATRGQNEQNKPESHRLIRNSASGVRNVHLDKSTGRYRVALTLDGKKKSFGAYESISEASEVADAVRRQYFTHLRESS